MPVAWCRAGVVSLTRERGFSPPRGRALPQDKTLQAGQEARL
jgi:hypothetical protein